MSNVKDVQEQIAVTKKRGYADQVMPLIQAIPAEALEKMGYENAAYARVSEGTSLNPEVEPGAFWITVTGKTGLHTYTPIPRYPFNWPLARVYKPYYDFCWEQLREMEALLSQPTDFADAPPDSRRLVECRLERSIRDSQYDYLLGKLGLREELVNQCVAKGMLEYDEIEQLKEPLVLQAMMDGIDDPDNAFFVPHRKFFAEIKSESKEHFCKTFLAQRLDMGEIIYRINYYVSDMQELLGPKESWMLEILDGFTRLKRALFDRGFPLYEPHEFFSGYAEGICFSVLGSLQMIAMNSELYAELIPVAFPGVQSGEAVVELIEYFHNSKERYQSILEEEMRKYPQKDASRNHRNALRQVRKEFHSSFITFDEKA